MSPIAAIQLASVPAGCMLLFTFIGLGIHVPELIAGALQHFAAGILLCTIGTELLPTMYNASGFNMNLSCFFGFFAGVCVMLSLGIIFPEHLHGGGGDHDHNDDEERHERAHKHDAGKETKGNRLRGRPSLLKASISHSMQMRSSVTSACESSSLLSKQSVVATFPSALLFAIAVDGAMDGLLIGIAMSAGPSAGAMMAASLCVEMSFLGLTLALALKGQGRISSITAAIVGPVSIVVGATFGGFLSSALSSNPAALAFLISFGASALLFMVAEELLLEAHESGDHVWWVDLQLYTGFFGSIMMSKFL